MAYDGVYQLVQPEGRGKRRSEVVKWMKVQPWDERTIVVYWFGAAMYPLDHVAVKPTAEAIFVTVNEQSPGRLSGRNKCAIVRLDEAIGGREVRPG